ncbi:MAG: alcohol dehydrogenase [Synergistaceae bacterium]
MLIVACQKCGELKVIAGSPDATGDARVMWTCNHCGTGQIMELVIGKDARRGDLNKIVKGLVFGKYPKSKNSLLKIPEMLKD